ncbi:MAG: ABC transporter ATP-binding protein/permease [Methanobrevibacter sp.]|jgi:ATP-binding cassette subfamily B protein|nr:ABC transporter ATP-binding protein/permease [Candidatus Methanovirga meridionalis]
MLNLFKKYFKPYIFLIILSLLFQIVQTLFTLYLPNLNAQIIDKGIVNGDILYIQNQGFFMMVLVFLQVSFSIVNSYLSTNVSLSIARNIRKDLYYKIQNFSSADINHFGVATLITRVTNDIQHVSTVLAFLFSVIINIPIIIVGSVIMAIENSLSLSMILFVVFSLIIPLIMIFTKKLKPLFELFQKQFDKVNMILRDQITGIQVVKSFVKEISEYERFKKANKELYGLNIRMGKLMSFFFPSFFLLPNFLILVTVWYGGILVNMGELEIGAITAFITYLIYITIALSMFAMILGFIPQAEVSARRILEVLNTETSITSPPKPIHIKNPQGNIKFKDVDFTYSNNSNNNSNNNTGFVLKNINFIAKSSEVTGIIGNTASGKSTLLQLIPRFYDVTNGMVSFDDINVKNLNIDELNSYINFIPQKSFLFSGTIAENLRLGKNDATEDELWEVLEIVQIADFIKGLDKEIHSKVSQRGVNLSGGQQQRLTIARAILSKPKVIIFDDSFSALDYSTDLKLRKALTKFIKNSTIIIVSQRISTIRDADNILVMDDGEIISQGKHTDLMKNCKIYESIVSSQLDFKNSMEGS